VLTVEGTVQTGVLVLTMMVSTMRVCLSCTAFAACRDVQDKFAAESHRKAAAAAAAGKFKAEIVPVSTTVKDPKTGAEQQVRI